MSDFKVDKINHVKELLNTCTMCGFCKSVCPSFKAIGWDGALSRGRIILTYGLLQGDIQPDESLMRHMYTCTTCADCVRRCPSKVDIVDVIEMCRADLVRNGHILPKHKAVADNVLTYNNPFGEKESTVEATGLKPRPSKLGYYAGCTATYRNKETQRSAISIFNKLGKDFTTVDEVCCGSVLQRIGVDNEKVIGLMKRNIESIRALGVETLVLSCAGCYRMFKMEYPKYVEVPFEVLHMTEFLSKSDLKLKSLGDRVVTYHDPCHLGRHCDVYDAPRDIIKKFPGVNFKEMPFNRSTSHCCGGGGGVRSAFPEESMNIGNTRLDEADFADVIITTCPFCVNNLAAAIGDRKVKIVDLTGLVDESL